MAEHASATPLERSSIPVGTIAEAQAQGLDIEQYPTCAKPNKLTGVLGCSWHDRCRVSAKAVSGPRNYGIELIKGKSTGGGFVRLKADCMWVADQAENIERNGGSFKVVANEGETFEMVTGILVSKATNLPTFQGDPLGRRVKRRVQVEVPKYARPEDNEALMVDVLRAESISAEKERRSDENRARNYGLESTIAPIDKRPARPNEGRKAQGGGSP